MERPLLGTFAADADLSLPSGPSSPGPAPPSSSKSFPQPLSGPPRSHYLQYTTRALNYEPDGLRSFPMLPGWENAIETTNFMKKAVAGLVNEDLTVDDIFVREVYSDPHRTSRSCARWELLADTGFCRCPTRLDCLALPCETIRDRRGAIQAALKHIWCQGCTFVARSRGRGRSPSIWDCRRKTCVRGLSIVSRCVVIDSVPSLIVSMLGTYSVLQIPTSSSESPNRTH
jgi:hypothetical protein